MRLETVLGRCMADTHGPSGVVGGRVRDGEAFCVRIGTRSVCCYCFNLALVRGMQAACADHWDDLLASGTLGTEDAPGPDEQHWADSLFANFYADVREAFVAGGDAPAQLLTPSAASSARDGDLSSLLAKSILEAAYS